MAKQILAGRRLLTHEDVCVSYMVTCVFAPDAFDNKSINPFFMAAKKRGTATRSSIRLLAKGAVA